MNDRSVVPAPLAGNYTDWHFSPGHWAANVLFLSGCTGAGKNGQVSTELAEQSRAAFEKLKLTLEVAGLNFSDLVEITTYHVGLQDGLETFKQIKDEYVCEPYPAWTAIGVTELAVPGAMIEIRAIATTGK